MDRVASTVFIVEDNLNVRAVLSRMLVAAGYGVRDYESAELFLRARDSTSPDCLLLELQRKLHGSPYALPIVFLTGKGDIEPPRGPVRGATRFAGAGTASLN